MLGCVRPPCSRVARLAERLPLGLTPVGILTALLGSRLGSFAEVQRERGAFADAFLAQPGQR